ncbi:MAG: TRAP transporter small permease [Lachnospiraceae bacterium]|nr:TRAP transporter small permease [Lachnospiraceae bacterium]
MKKVLNGLTKIENLIMVVTFVIMVCASFAQVVNRNIFKLPISWFDEAAIYCMIYMVLIGTEVGLRDGTQIAVTAIVDKFQGKGKAVLQILSKIVVVLFSFGVFMGGMKLMDIQIRTGQISAALGIPMTIPYGAMVVSFAIITLVQALEAVSLVIDVLQNKTKEEK